MRCCARAAGVRSTDARVLPRPQPRGTVARDGGGLRHTLRARQGESAAAATRPRVCVPADEFESTNDVWRLRLGCGTSLAPRCWYSRPHLDVVRWLVTEVGSSVHAARRDVRHRGALGILGVVLPVTVAGVLNLLMDKGSTALMAACCCGHLDAAHRFLVEVGRSNPRGRDKVSALSLPPSLPSLPPSLPPSLFHWLPRAGWLPSLASRLAQRGASALGRTIDSVAQWLVDEQDVNWARCDGADGGCYRHVGCAWWRECGSRVSQTRFEAR
jgi:hypothetical protein